MNDEKNTGEKSQEQGGKENNKAIFTGRIKLANETVDRDAPPPRPSR